MAKHNQINTNNRRSFLRKLAGAGCASLSLTPLLSGITNLSLINAIARANQPIYSGSTNDNYKALVCIMLAGGNDSFNMLVPYDIPSHNLYTEARGGVHDASTNPIGIALEHSSLNPLGIPDADGKQYGLHSQMGRIKELYEGTNVDSPGEQYVSFVANVGTLAEPLTSIADLSPKPNQLFSHSNQIMAWQSGVVQGERQTGWGGRMADILQSCNDYNDISMNISLSGLNLFQRGNSITEYTIQRTGNGGIRRYDDFYLQELYNDDNLYLNAKNATVDTILEQDYQNILQQAYSKTLSKSLETSDAFSSAISGFEIIFNEPFPNTIIGNQLQMVAKSIATRNDLGNGGINRQTFYVSMSNYDSHDNLMEEHGNLMKELNDAIYAFYKAIKQIGDIEGDTEFLSRVAGYTMSDFARTLSSNGNGSDHAWGGHHLAFGGAINGGQILGTYPDFDTNLDPNSPDCLDVGNGRIIPTTSCDEYFADLALWFADDGNGANGNSSLSYQSLKSILPNIEEFVPQTLNQVANADRLGLFA